MEWLLFGCNSPLLEYITLILLEPDTGITRFPMLFCEGIWDIFEKFKKHKFKKNKTAICGKLFWRHEGGNFRHNNRLLEIHYDNWQNYLNSIFGRFCKQMALTIPNTLFLFSFPANYMDFYQTVTFLNLQFQHFCHYFPKCSCLQ